MPKSKTYEEFVEKFKPKKTTDDCYTPPTIYEIVKQWACNEYAARKDAINAQKWAAYAVRKGSTNGNDDAKITAVKDAMTKQVLALPESSQSILRAYTGFTATRVNYAIRNGNITPQVRETIAALDNALANGTMPQDVTLYRNTAPSFLDLGLPKNPTEQELQTIVRGRRPLFFGNRGASECLKFCARKISVWGSVRRFIVSRPAFQNAMSVFTGMAPENAKNLMIRRTFSDGVNAMTALMLF